MGFQVPAKSAKFVILSSIFEPPGTLHRICRIQRIHRKWTQAWQNRPWVPRAWEQDDGSLHKVPQIGCRVMNRRAIWLNVIIS